MGKTEITLFGGTDSIGGNKIALLTAKGKGILFDFGLNFNTSKKYLDEFIKIRKSRALFDYFFLHEL